MRRGGRKSEMVRQRVILICLIGWLVVSACAPKVIYKDRVVYIKPFVAEVTTSDKIHAREPGSLGWWQPRSRRVVLPHLKSWYDFDTLVVYGHEMAHILGYEHPENSWDEITWKGEDE